MIGNLFLRKKKLHIDGMMCSHCEAAVKKALEELPSVREAIVDHQSGTAVVRLNQDVTGEELKKAVENEGYMVTGIE